MQRRHRYESEVGDLERRDEREVLLPNPLENRFIECDKVHFVHGHDDVAYSEHARKIGMAARLGKHPLAGVDQDHRGIGGGSGGEHIARVLLVARCVGDDGARGVAVAVRDVDVMPCSRSASGRR